MPANAATLSALLERERSLLVAGALEDIAALAPEKERLARMLSVDRPEGLIPLQATIRRNETLLAAALAGLQQARETVSGLGHGGSLRTYDCHGQSRGLGGGACILRRV
ncbi:hypothetical protein C8N32_109101 [Rhodovulum imhoffii]|uniref:FlgN protein n=1 Tax=Rhodovulum imhoffii TaxID=365340 RepID=A0A2T5BRS2_9RHOB|nr:hypothetical protein [Rhodovulum imhoffii]MBK5933735.1 hypothetical protein [Rhodovulum imhoffii]PTN01977.1 hypothetical protein C8N32_109101 [Rhodovulum imhoffii]